MTTPEQITYIREQLALGASRGDITNALVASNWTLPDINEAFASLSAEVAIPPIVVSQNSMPTEVTPVQTLSKFRSLLLPIAVVIVVVVLGGGTTYAYLQKIGPFASAPYNAGNLISGLLVSSAQITSSSYNLSAALAVGPRDEGAVPFTIQGTSDPKLIAQYKNDAKRVSDISALLMKLQFHKDAYPDTLKQFEANGNPSFYDAMTDPVSGQEYVYTVTDGGKNFSLSATFETTSAVLAIEDRYGFATSTTPIHGQTVTFTKNSSQFLSLSPEPPKPFLVQASEMLQYLPPEISASLSVGAASDWSKSLADWKAQFSANGDFGDMSIKFDVEALKKEKDYYFRVNKIPSLFAAYISSIKGQWIKVDTAALATSSASTPYANEFQMVAKSIPQNEAEYKKNKAEAADELMSLAKFADETHLLSFKDNPRSEKVDGQIVYRYNLQINKDAVLDFYKKVVADAKANPTTNNLGFFDDPGMIDYLQSNEFSQTVDYLNANTTITLSVDQKGFLSALAYTMRIIPPDTATPLAGKQINLTLKLELSNINQPVDIVAPTESRPIQELIDEVKKSMGVDSANGNDPAIRSDLAMIQTQAELFYNKGNTYGIQLWSSGKASSCKGGMFKNSTISMELESADSENGEGKNVACYASGKNYIAGADLASDGWWCIDSSGASKKEVGSIPLIAPQNKKCP